MKTKYWIAIFALFLAACGGLSLVLLSTAQPAQQVEIWSDGKLIDTLSLLDDQQITVESSKGSNVVTIRDGAVAVTEADCPDSYCMKRGFCDGGTDIVCLPNRLVIGFLQKQEIDAVVG